MKAKQITECGKPRDLFIDEDLRSLWSNLPILTDRESKQVLIDWNATTTKYPKQRCVQELFEGQVNQSPDAIALEFEGKQFSYKGLNARANQLAHYLRKRGIGPDCLVGICMQRSPDLIVAMLAVLKAGGAYVPLDPNYPRERLAFMLADTGTRILLTEKCQLVQLPKNEAEVICLDTDWCAIAQESEWNPMGSARADNLAYVIYTSGSTGRPKGVAVPHRAVIRLVCNTNYVELGPGDRVAQVSNCSFDAATFEIWGALLQGACLVGIVKDVVLSSKDFAAQICDHKISTLFLTTVLFNQFVSEVPSAFKGVRHLLFGGEAPDPKWARELLNRGAPERLLHVYGPTESTTFACWYLVEQVHESTTTIPIGRPISNTQIYLLDSCLRPVPVGVTGELYIGGDGLARGYLNRTEITAETFVPHPFSSEPGARLYKTGDLARYLVNGNIEFRGRMDNQVKIRGFRIELEEIETAIKQHPLVRQAVSVVEPMTAGVKSLSVYIVTEENQSRPATNDLREFLKERLPEYMVPTRFVFLNSMPLTLNGKVDRNRLVHSADNAKTNRKRPLPIKVTRVSKHSTFSFEREYPKDKCIHELFEEQVERTPEAVAVVWEQQQLTYRQLNARANQLGHYLRKRGVGPEVLVGICVERSLEMVIGLLGILKAGGAYVPLDPSYPTSRLLFMLEDTRAPIVLTQKHLLELLPTIQGRAFCLDSDWEMIRQEDQENLKNCAVPENPVYLLYTSGSTGTPKGVVMRHRPLCNLVTWQLQNSKLSRWAKTLQFAPLSFDVSFQEIFSTWCSGGTLLLISDNLRRDPSALLQLISEQSVERVFLPFVAMQRLVEAVDIAQLVPNSIREVITAGEQLRMTPHIATIFKKLKNCTLYNQYGPTESHVVSAFALTETPEHWPELPPIGRPIANTQICLLDSHRNRVPIGAVGELYVGGVGLARGYHNRPELTAERFVPHPFSEEAGARLYRTGDLARYDADGNLHFLGRIDHQVKIRGYRIEPGEIETALEEHPAVRQAVVLAREDRSGETQLVAYIVPKQEQTCAINELRSHVKQKLPDFMVPSAFVMLDRLPTTPNGKLDRKALPPPNWGRLELEASYQAPITPVEQLMADIWGEVLGIEHVGIHDNFFDIGGHSLLAMKLSSKLSVATKRHISVRSLFLYPSIAALADALQSFSPLDGAPRIRNLNQKHTDPLQVSVESTTPQPSSPHLKIERRSLLSLLSTGKIAPVDSAALGYLPDSILVNTEVTKREVIHDWYDDLPTLSAITATSLGRIGIITLPRFRSELYHDSDSLLALIVEALELAQRIGARTVSMTGLIPSATEYGYAVAKAIAGREDLPRITTGHATTAATVTLAIKRILEESGRDLRHERVGFLGLGSIGRTVLRLMLRSLPHPAEITLCDLYSKLDSLEEIRKKLVNELDFNGPVKVVGATNGLPKGFYHSTLIVGATNVPEVLDIGLVKEGTLIVDDSGPHCFKTEDAMQRFLDRKDILFSEGGSLLSPDPVTQLRFLPQEAEHRAGHFYRKVFANFNPFRITGCVFSSLLCSLYDELEPTVGLADDRESLLHYQKLISLGFRAADLHCEGRVLPQENIRNFHRRFGEFRHGQRQSDDGTGERTITSG